MTWLSTGPTSSYGFSSDTPLSSRQAHTRKAHIHPVLASLTALLLASWAWFTGGPEPEPQAPPALVLDDLEARAVQVKAQRSEAASALRGEQSSSALVSMLALTGQPVRWGEASPECDKAATPYPE